MDRREFLDLAGKGAIGAAALGLVGCSTQEAAPTAAAVAGEIAQQAASDSALPTLDWQMATSWSPALDILLGSAQLFADRVAALTSGKFKITPRAAGELAPGLEVLNVVEQGAVPIGHTASYYYLGKSPATAFGTTVPFGLTARQQNSWLYAGGGLDLMQNFYRDRFGVIQFPAGNTGAQMGGWWKKEIEQTSDLQGLKVRIPGLGGQVMAKLGATVQVLAGGEIFQALQTGAVDAAEWVGPYDDEKLGLNDAATYYYGPGWWEPGSSLEVQINLAEWEKLPDLYKEAVRSAAAEANVTMLARYDSVNNSALQSLLGKGVQLRAFTTELMRDAEDAANSIYDEFAQADADFKAIYDQWKGFRDTLQEWHSAVETVYLDYVASKSQ
jgi:TRAP-type mannitol/chloroaromatic compound transport system substrate-binding protein